MPLNWKEINLILSELNLEDSFIRQISQPDYEKIILDIYNRKGAFKILISMSNPDCRLHICTKKLKNLKKPPRFTSFLRAHIKNCRLKTAEHVNNDRIIKFTLLKNSREIFMWIKLWAGASNIIVTDSSNNILETFYRRKNKKEITGELFLLPEPKTSNNNNSFKVRELHGTGTFNEKIEQFYYNKENKGRLEQLRISALKVIDTKISSTENKLDKVKSRKNRYRNNFRDKQIGDIIKANAYRIEKGDNWLKADDFFNPGEQVEIKLNPDLSPIENADHFYSIYKKQKNKLVNIDKEVTFLEKTHKELFKEKHKIEKSNDMAFLKSCLKPEPGIKKTEDKTPGMIFSSKGYKIIVGRKADDNDNLLRKYVKGNDYWLHTRDYPGAYVFIKSIKGKSIPLEVLLDAGTLAVFYSKAKSSGQGDVYYTQVKYLRRPKNGKKGLVLPTQEKNLFIKLEEKRMKRIFKSDNSTLDLH